VRWALQTPDAVCVHDPVLLELSAMSGMRTSSSRVATGARPHAWLWYPRFI